jgi:hypothetical protein
MEQTAFDWGAFEPIRRGTLPPARFPTATIQKGGTVGLNQPALDALGNPDRIQVLYSLDPPQLAFRATSADDPGAYVVQKNGRGAVINPRTALQTLGLDLDVARRYVAQAVPGGLVVDLSQEATPVSPGRPARVVQASGAA